MSEDKKRDKKNDETKRRLRRFWSAFAALTIIFCLVWMITSWNCRSADDKLAAINAARVIPASEDAGVAYYKLAEDYQPIPIYPPVVNRQTLSLTFQEPWDSNDYPNLAEWLDEQQDLISKLLDISRIEKCRLAILSDSQQGYFTNPARLIRGWVHLLIRSGNLDAGEDRIDDAIEKYTCILRMGSHMRQQPVLNYYNNGVADESMALRSLEKLITQTELSEKQLTTIEAALLPAKNKWKQDSRIMVKVQSIFEQKERMPPKITDWRRYWKYWKAMSKSNNYLLDGTLRSHLYTLAERRRMYILIALRRYKNKTGHWPQSLDRIKPSLSNEILTDPVNNELFIYELKDKGVALSDRGVK